jgi:hypothetical protein
VLYHELKITRVERKRSFGGTFLVLFPFSFKDQRYMVSATRATVTV